MVKQNTAQLWDSVWARSPSVEKDLYAVRKEEQLVRWQRMEATIAERFGGFEGLSVIELGGGRGTNAALMAARGAHVTVLDYSEGALERSRRVFEGLELQVDLVLHDALDLPDVLCGRYDVSMSFGLAEHFTGEPRAAIVKAHFDVLKEGGIAFISVPNAHNPPYRLYKWITERTGRWTIGEEYPFSRRELESHCTALGIEEHGFFGDSLWRSKKFLNPIKWLPRRKKKARASNGETGSTAPASHEPDTAARESDAAAREGSAAAGEAQPATSERQVHAGKRRYRRVPRRERGTRWDDRYSYALVLWGAKPVA